MVAQGGVLVSGEINMVYVMWGRLRVSSSLFDQLECRPGWP